LRNEGIHAFHSSQNDIPIVKSDLWQAWGRKESIQEFGWKVWRKEATGKTSA